MKLVLILGMHRSGTSVLAKAVQALGAQLSEDLVPAQRDNPKGFYEDVDVYKLNRRIFEKLNIDWDSLVGPCEVSSQLKRSITNDIKDLLRKKSENYHVWGLKEPRITRLLQFWLPACIDTVDEIKIILAHRHPLEVADSLTKRNNIPTAQGLSLWALHQSDALEALARRGGLVVSYARLLEAPDTELRRIHDFLALDEELQQNNIVDFKTKFIDRQLRHQQHSKIALLENGHIARVCLPLYERLELLSDSPHPLSAEESLSASTFLEQFRKNIDDLSLWFSAIDSLHSQRRSEARAMEQRLADINAQKIKVESELAWIESRRLVRFLSYSKRLLSRQR